MITNYFPKARRHVMTSLFLTMTLLLSVIAGIIPAQNATAATTIKTQAAADKVKNGIYGIDVSKYQGTINWSKVASDNVSFVMCRATYGTDIDPTFVTNAKGAYNNGLNVGAYHFARFKDSASVKNEARAFIRQLQKVTITYPVALDIETNPSKLTKLKLTNLCIEFLEILKDYGYRVVIYSYQNFFLDTLRLSSLDGYDIWVANYLEEPTSIDRVMWQYSSKGRISGITGDVDLNVAYKNLAGRKRSSSLASQSSGTQSTQTSTKQTRQPTTYEIIVDFLNEHYNAGLNANANHTMDEINHVLYKAFQTEANKQLGASLTVNGVPTAEELGLLSDITFTQDQTRGRITTLIQSKLYFRRNIDAISGVYDAGMITALKALQSACDIEPTGEMDRQTWSVILGIR